MRLTHLLLGIAALFLLALAIPVSSGSGKAAAKGTACLSNLKRQAHALAQYAGDHDDRLPLRDAWMDATRLYFPLLPPPYVAPERCPELPASAFGYAFNARLSAAREPTRPEAVPLVYDSLNPIRNASDRVASLPPKGRHTGRNGVANADGHVRRVAP